MPNARASRPTSLGWPRRIEILSCSAAALGVTSIAFDIARFGRYFAVSRAGRRIRMHKSNRGASSDTHRRPEQRPGKHLRSAGPLLGAPQLLLAARPALWPPPACPAAAHVGGLPRALPRDHG